MSQFTLTTQEDALVLNTLRNRANHSLMMLGSADEELEALISKIQSQMPQPEPVVEEVAEVVVEEVVIAKPKKAKAAQETEPTTEEAPAAE
jgi:hypothetical protein